MTVTIKGLFFLLYCTNKVAAFVQGTDIRITCSAPGTLPTWVKGGITIANEGSSTINTAAFPRITYAADQSTLQLSSLESGDAGTYTCSFFAGGSGTFVVSVDVVLITGNGCPAEDAGFPFITCTCATANETIQEFQYKVLEPKSKKNKKIKVCPKLVETTNSTGCSAGSDQETAGFQYTKGDNSRCRKLRVNIIGNLLHSTTGDTVHDSRTCTQDYYIDACCCELEIAGHVLCVIDVIILFIVAFMICCKFLNCWKYYKWCLCFCNCCYDFTHTIICPLDGSHIQWRKIDVPAQITDECNPTTKTASSRIKHAPNNRDLLIASVESGHVGTYVCSAEGQTSQFVSVTFTSIGIFTVTGTYTEFDVLTVETVDTLIVPCPIPVTKPQWRKIDDVPAQITDERNPTTNTASSRIRHAPNDRDLIISSVEPGHAGTYEFYAEGHISHSVSVTFTRFGTFRGTGTYTKIDEKPWKCKWICLLILGILMIVGSLIGVIVIREDPVLPDGELDECCGCTGRIVNVSFMGLFTTIGFGLLIGVSCFPEKMKKLLKCCCCCCSATETPKEDGEAQTDNPLTVCMTACKITPCSSVNALEETQNRRRVETTVKITEHHYETLVKKRPLPDKPTKDVPPQGKTVLPEIKDNKLRTDPQNTPRPLPPIKKGQD